MKKIVKISNEIMKSFDIYIIVFIGLAMIFSAVRKITLYPKAGIKLNDINKSMVAQYKKEMREKEKN